MTISTVTVSIAVNAITGVALPLARVRFALTGPDIDAGIVAPDPVTVTLDAGGLGTVLLFPNASGTQGTQYRVTITDQNGEMQFNGLATIPATNCNLHDVLNLAAPPVVSDAQTAATAAQGYAAAASVAAAPAPVSVILSRNLVASDSLKALSCTTALTLTIQAGLPSGFRCFVEQAGTGQITIAAGAGVALRNVASQLKTASQYAMVSVVNVGAETYNLSGSTGP